MVFKNMSTGLCLVLLLYLQEPVSHVVARPSPSDILEWRKFVSHCYISYINLCGALMLYMCSKGKIVLSAT